MVSKKGEGLLVGKKVIVDDSTFKGFLVEKGFGNQSGRNLVLDLFEVLFLSLQKKLVVYSNDSKKVSVKKLFSLGLKQKDFYKKLLVYSDLKEKGYCVKTGLKFGFDFRVYPKGKKVGETHSKFVVQILNESEKVSMTQLSRMTRLSGNIHTKFVFAVIDNENFINYYESKRILF